jgi:hypothetical protein
VLTVRFHHLVQESMVEVSVVVAAVAVWAVAAAWVAVVVSAVGALFSSRLDASHAVIL